MRAVQLLFELDERNLVSPLDARRFASLPLSFVIQLGQEMFAEDPLLPRNAPERARRLAMLLALKQPGMNAALFVAPARAKDQVWEPAKNLRCDQARSKRSRFITLFQAAAKSFTNFSFESAHA